MSITRPTVAILLPLKIRNAWQAELATAALRMHYATTAECSAAKVDICVVEDVTERAWFANRPDVGFDFYLPRENGTLVSDLNALIAARPADYYVHSGGDLLPGPGWLEAMLAPFATLPDCAGSTTIVAEAGAWIGPERPMPGIVEGHYGPFMMFSRGWSWDPVYTGKRADDDMIMRMYVAGKRSYRNCAAIAYHIGGAFWDTATEAEKATNDAGDEVFRARWTNSPLEIATKILTGHVWYGREHARGEAPAAKTRH